MREYNVKITVRNNLILSAIAELGFKTQSEFARSCDMTPSELNKLVGLREAPIGANGEFTEAAKRLMEALGAAPSDLWTDAQLTMELKRNTAYTTRSETELRALLENHQEAMTLPSPEDAAIGKELEFTMSSLLKGLDQREMQILKLRHGFYGGKELTLEEIGDKVGVSRNRIMQIEAKAMRKLRRSTEQLTALFES